MLQNKQEFAKSKNISVPILDSWIYRHGLPVIRIGGRIYLDEADYVSWVDAHKTVISIQPKKPIEEIALPKQCRKSSLANKMRRIY